LRNIPIGLDAGYWRVQTPHIVYAELGLVNGYAADNGHHDHGIPTNASDQEGYASIQGSSSAPGGEVRTTGSGTHGHTVSGVIPIGTGTASDAAMSVFRNPTQGVYIWERTA
jgi:hypothetical protein